MDNKLLLCILLLLGGVLRVTGQSGLADTVRQEGAALVTSLKSKGKPVKDSLRHTFSKFTKIKRDTSAHWEIALQNSFVQDVDSSYFGEGLFSDYSIRRNMTIAGIPLGVEGHLVLQNSIVNKRFSGVKVAFDAKQFTESYRQKLMAKDWTEKLREQAGGLKPDLLEDIGDKTGKALVKEQFEKGGDKIGKQLGQQIQRNGNLMNLVEKQKAVLLDSLQKLEKTVIDTARAKAETRSDSLQKNDRIAKLKAAIVKLDQRKDTLQQQIVFWEKQSKETRTWVGMEQKKVSSIKSGKEVLGYTEQLPRTLQSAPSGIDTLISKYITLDSGFVKKIKRVREYGDYQQNALVNQQKKLREMQEWKAKKEQEWEALQDPDKIKNYAEEQSMKISPLHKILLGMKKLEIGTVRLNDSPLLVGSMPANGISGEWQSGKYNLSAAIGQEGQSDSRLVTDFVRNTNRFGLNRSVMQVKGGLGDPERTYYGMSFTRFTSDVPFSVEENPTPQHTSNVLVGFNGQQYLNKSLFVNGRVVYSNTDVTGATPTNILLNPVESTPLNSSAFESALGYDLKKSESIVEAGYSYIGGGYRTIGNPFLITNRNDIKLKVKQKLFKKRLAIIGEARFSTNLNNGVTPQANQNLYSADVSWRLNKKGDRVWAKFQPMVFAQQVGDLKNAVQINTMVAGYQTSGKIGKSARWNTVLQGMNFRQESNAADTAFTVGRIYSTAQQSLQFGRWMVVGSGYGGFEKGKAVEGQIALTNSWMSDNYQIDAGVQMLKRPFDPQPRKGATGGFSVKIKKWGAIGGNVMWLRQIEGETKPGFYATSFIRIII